MIKLPLSVFIAMIAFNITAFTIFLQLDMLIFNSIIVKIIAWTLTIGAWTMVYLKRNKIVTLF
jgi:hypothetical protein